MNSLPLYSTSRTMGRTIGTMEKRYSVPQSVLASSDVRGVAGGVVMTTQARVVASVVASAATVKYSVPLTPTSGPVRRLFAATTTAHSSTTQTITSVVTVTQTTAVPLSSLAPGGLVQSSGSGSGLVPQPPRVPLSSTGVGPQQPLAKPIQPITTASTIPLKPPQNQTDHFDSKTTKPDTVPAASSSYSRVIGSHLTNQVAAASSSSSSGLIEQPLQQIMKTPTIFQEPATQLTKPKKYSDAVGKKVQEGVLPHSTSKPLAPGNNLVITASPSCSVGGGPVLVQPTLSLPPSLPAAILLPASLSSSLPPSLPPPPHPVAHSLNLAPGSRPTLDDITSVSQPNYIA